jgi:hypothetical protein
MISVQLVWLKFAMLASLGRGVKILYVPQDLSRI